MTGIALFRDDICRELAALPKHGRGKEMLQRLATRLTSAEMVLELELEAVLMANLSADPEMHGGRS